MLGNSRERYGLASRFLHWSTALLVLGLIGLGWWMVRLTYYDPWYNRATSLHEGLGVLAWLLALAFAIGHLINRPPKSLPLGPWERAGAWAAHKLLYLGMLVLPVAGFLISTADGRALDVFGLVSIPAVIADDDRVRDAAIAVHTYGGYGMLGLVGLHAAAALKHHLFDRDRTLMRMIVGR